MNKILCFGDSNTFGFNFEDCSRFEINKRWSGILKNKLAKLGFDVIEAGCNNRTCFSYGEHRGVDEIEPYLADNYHTIILALGINDLQRFYSFDEKVFEDELYNLIKKAQNSAKVVLLCPCVLDDEILKGNFSFQFDKNSIEKSKKLSSIYKNASKRAKCKLIELDTIAKTAKDGLHFDFENHTKIASILFNYFSTL